MNVQQLTHEAGKLDFGKGVWLAPIILRETGATPEQVAAAERAIQKQVHPDYVQSGPDGTRLPSDFALESLGDAIVALDKCGFKGDARALLVKAGEFAASYETHIALSHWHGRGKQEPFRATLFATGKPRYDMPAAEWGEDAAALSQRVRDQLRPSDEIATPVREFVDRVFEEGRTVGTLRQTWNGRIQDLLRENPSTQETRDLIDAAQMGLGGDNAAADRWIRKAVSEGPANHTYFLQAIGRATATFCFVGSMEGAQLATSIGREFVKQAGVELPADIDHPVINGVQGVNGQRFQVGTTTELDTWRGFFARAELASRLDPLARALNQPARSELGREVLILAANLASGRRPSSPEVEASRLAIRKGVSAAARTDLATALDQMADGVAQSWTSLSDNERKALSKVLKEDVQRHPDVYPARSQAPNHWVFGGDVPLSINDGPPELVNFVETPNTPVTTKAL